MAKNIWRVCRTCDGDGKIVNPALSVWTASDREDDPESFANMLAGLYDITCPECNGRTTVNTQMEQDYAESRQEHFEMLREQGIGPGHPDWF